VFAQSSFSYPQIIRPIIPYHIRRAANTMPSHHTKHVRFAYKNVFHSPPVTPAMPPLTFSSSTDPSSLGVITPPSAFYPVPLPNPSKSYHVGNTRPHPYLDIHGINWDMMDHPSTMSRNHHSISGRAWKEPATSPPLPSMSITIATSHGNSLSTRQPTTTSHSRTWLGRFTTLCARTSKRRNSAQLRQRPINAAPRVRTNSGTGANAARRSTKRRSAAA
jgi:hypothetical protein